MAEGSFRDLFEQAEHSPDYWHELTVIDLTDEIVASMDRLGINRTELARRLETSPAYVTKLLGGVANFTLMTLTKLAMALESEVHLHLAPRGAHTWWVDDLTEIWASGAECCIHTLSGTETLSASAAVSTGSEWVIPAVGPSYSTTAVSPEEGVTSEPAAA